MIPKTSVQIRNYLLAGAMIALAAAGCNKKTDTPTVAPASETMPVVYGVTGTTAISGGNITDYGTAYTIDASGVCWSATNQAPTISDSKTSDGTALYFKSALTGLTPNTKYYLRAYIQNSAGVGYGKLVTFTTSSGTADTTVTTSTLAGNSSAGFANGTGVNATFNAPQGVVADAAGNLYVSDSFNHLIRKITAAGVVTTYAGTGELGFQAGTATTAKFYSPQGLALDASGNLYVADQGVNSIYKITPAGVVTILAGDGTSGSSNGTGSAARFNSPQGLAVDATGNVYVADRNNNRIRKITPAGVVTNYAGTGSVGYVNGDATTLATFSRPTGIAIDGSGNLFVTDLGNSQIRKITTAGVVSAYFGNPNITDALNSPSAIAIDAQNNIYLTDQSGRIMRIVADNSALYTIAGAVNTSGFADGTKTVSRFSSPTGIAVDASKNIYVADLGNNRIRKIVIK